MFAGKRAPIPDHEVGGFFHEVAVRAYAVGSLEIEGDTAVHAAIAKVPENRPLVMEFAEKLVEIPQVHAEDGRGDRGIFPGRPGFFFTRHAARADSGFAN